MIDGEKCEMWIVIIAKVYIYFLKLYDFQERG
jgi:hypothetical protein